MPWDAPIESSLIRRIIKDLQELGSSKMKHELRIYGEIVGQSEGDGIVFSVLCELLAEANEHSVEPPEHVRRIIDLGLEDRNAGHENCC